MTSVLFTFFMIAGSKSFCNGSLCNQPEFPVMLVHDKFSTAAIDKGKSVAQLSKTIVTRMLRNCYAIVTRLLDFATKKFPYPLQCKKIAQLLQSLTRENLLHNWVNQPPIQYIARRKVTREHSPKDNLFNYEEVESEKNICKKIIIAHCIKRVQIRDKLCQTQR